jgi:hypothetical protein
MTYNMIKALVETRGHKFFDEGNYNINIVGVRSKTTKAGKFDDHIYVAYRSKGRPIVFEAKATLDPGTKYLLSPLNRKGTAIIAPGQYRGAYKIGIHGRSWKSGGYKALEQKKPMFYYRDNNKDRILDRYGNKSYENGKTNIHRASKWKIEQWVGGYSAGCQVVQNSKKFDQLMYICEKAKRIHGNSFTYTLIQL